MKRFFPAPFYYGWGISAAGVLLDYRAGIGDEERRIIGSRNGSSVADGSGAKPSQDPVHGILREDILGTLISFDYDWKSEASFRSKNDDAGKTGNPGLACLHEGIVETRLHQPNLFPVVQIR